MTRTNRIITTLGAAVAGATVGYLVSAPARGRDTRRRLSRRLEHETGDLVLKTEHSLKDARQRLSDALRG